MAAFVKPEHRAVATALRAMDHDLLMAQRCWFAGGTEIVLGLGEYRLSKMWISCAAMPMAIARCGRGQRAAFRHCSARSSRRNGHSASTNTAYAASFQPMGFPLRVEIIRKSRISLAGCPDMDLGVPRLVQADRIAEKLLANADRCQDRSTAFRDAADLGMLALRCGPFPEIALVKAEAAYGDDIGGKLVWALERLSETEERTRASATLGMDSLLLEQAVLALSHAVRRLRPELFPS